MMKDEWRMMKDERRMMKVEWWKLKMKDDDFKLLRGFADWRTNGRTDICDCRVAFVTEKIGFRLFDFWIRISIFKLRIGLVLNCFDLQRWNEHFSILLLGKSCILNISAKILWVSILLKNNFLPNTLTSHLSSILFRLIHGDSNSHCAVTNVSHSKKPLWADLYSRILKSLWEYMLQSKLKEEVEYNRKNSIHSEAPYKSTILGASVTWNSSLEIFV